jgi:hypothetical protein
VGGGIEAGTGLQVVEAELDLGGVESDVGAALHVGRAAAGVVHRLPVHRDAHHVEGIRRLGGQLAAEGSDVHALVVVHGHRLVVDGLHPHERGVALEEAGVHDVVRGDESAPLVLGARARQHSGPA